MSGKISIRFFEDREERAVRDDDHAKWWFSVWNIVKGIDYSYYYEEDDSNVEI